MNLPDKPSELIRLALADLAKCEADPAFEVDMCFWYLHQTEGDPCVVCLAGAVMAQTLREVSDMLIDGCSREIFPTEFGTSNDRKLAALNSFRLGNVKGGLRWLQRTTPFENREIVPYDIDPEQFRADMHLLADDLERAGL